MTNNTKVSKGDLIGEIDDRDYKAKLAALEASIRASEKNIEIIDQKISIGQNQLEQAGEKLKLAATSFNIVSTDFTRVQELNKAKFANKFAELNLPIPEASLRGIYGKFSCGPSCFDSNNRGKPRGI